MLVILIFDDLSDYHFIMKNNQLIVAIVLVVHIHTATLCIVLRVLGLFW